MRWLTRIKAGLYFINRGIVYGLMLGAFTGTILALFPLGTVLGAVFGLFIGLAVGIGVTLFVIPFFLASYILGGTDLKRHSPRLALLVAIILATVTICLMIWAVGLNFYPDIKTTLNASILLGGFWAILSAAYVTRLYPYYLAQGYEPDLFLPASNQPSNFLLRETGRLTSYISIGLLLCLGLIGGTALHIKFQGAEAFQDMRHLGMCCLVAVLSLGVSLFYTTMGNAELLRFLKLLLFHDYLPWVSPQIVRVLLTVVTFFATCLYVWWIWLIIPIGVPIIAFYSAYHAYHTLAWSKEDLEETRGKEATSTI